jgi:hypothetical protein
VRLTRALCGPARYNEGMNTANPVDLLIARRGIAELHARLATVPPGLEHLPPGYSCIETELAPAEARDQWRSLALLGIYTLLGSVKQSENRTQVAYAVPPDVRLA